MGSKFENHDSRLSPVEMPSYRNSTSPVTAFIVHPRPNTGAWVHASRWNHTVGVSLYAQAPQTEAMSTPTSKIKVTVKVRCPGTKSVAI